MLLSLRPHYIVVFKTTLTAGLELPIAEADGSMLGAVTPEEEVSSLDGKDERPARKPLQPKVCKWLFIHYL